MALGNAANVVVRRTFIESVEENAADKAGPMSRGRACSDSMLDVNRKLADYGEEDCPDFQLEGLSDAETGPDADAAPQITPQTSESTDVEQKGPALIVTRGPSDDKESSSASASRGWSKGEAPCNDGASEQSMAALMAENMRLASENKLLRDHSRLRQENTTLWSNTTEPQESTAKQVEQVLMSVGPAAGFWDGSHARADANGRFQQVVYQAPGQVGYYPMAVPVRWADPSMAAGSAPNPDGERGSRRSRRQRGGGQTAEAGAASAKAFNEPAEDNRTTVMLRNLPNNYTRAMVLNLLDCEGFKDKYNFFYLPIDFKTNACLGYAFVNLTSTSFVSDFWQKFEGFHRWALPSKKVCGVTWSGPHQGLAAHVERYRNSPVMHPSVPEGCRPLVLVNGQRAPFPSSTRMPKAPRMRNYEEKH